MVLWELNVPQYFSIFHMSTVVMVYETNSCDGRVGAKPTGQDINGSLSGYYITHLKHRIFFGKMAFWHDIWSNSADTILPNSTEVYTGSSTTKSTREEYFFQRLSFGNSFDFWLDWTSCSPKYGTQKIWFLVSEPCLQTLNIFCGILSQPTNKKKQKLLENLVLCCWQVSKCQSEPFLRHFSCRLQFVWYQVKVSPRAFQSPVNWSYRNRIDAILRPNEIGWSWRRCCIQKYVESYFFCEAGPFNGCQRGHTSDGWSRNNRGSHLLF